MKPKIRTHYSWDDEKEIYSVSFKISYYDRNGELLFSEKIFPVPSKTEDESQILDILMAGIKTWLKHYDLKWEDFIIEDKRVYSIFKEEISEKDIPF